MKSLNAPGVRERKPASLWGTTSALFTRALGKLSPSECAMLLIVTAVFTNNVTRACWQSISCLLFVVVLRVRRAVTGRLLGSTILQAWDGIMMGNLAQTTPTRQRRSSLNYCKRLITKGILFMAIRGKEILLQLDPDDRKNTGENSLPNGSTTKVSFMSSVFLSSDIFWPGH